MSINRRRLLTGTVATVIYAARPKTPSNAALLLRGSGTNAQMLAAGIFDVKVSYGATGNGVLLPDSAMTNGSPNLGSATAAFVSGDVGKTICVGGAGVSGAPLVTTILTFTDATHVVLAAAASTTVTGAITHYGTDDTLSIQAAINACCNANGGVIFFAPGIYIVNGNFQNASTHNAQLIIPKGTASNGRYPAITLMGVADPVSMEPPPIVLTDDAPSTSGSILFSPRNGSGSHPAVIGAWKYLDIFDFSLVHPTLANLIIRTAYLNPNGVIGANFSNAAWAGIENVLFDVDATPNQIGATQPKSNTYAYVSPCQNNGAYSRVRDCYAMGYDIGFMCGEHADVDDTQTYFCRLGFSVGDTEAFHEIHFHRVGAYSCLQGIGNPGAFAPLKVEMYNTEHDNVATHWFNNPTDIVDGGNKILGTLTYNVVVSSVGRNNADFNKTGGANFTCTALF